MIEEKVLATIKKYDLIKPGERVVIGVSGGPDSMCLLHLLHQLCIKHKYDFSIVVAHVNHKIRKEAEQDEEYVMNFCHKIGIECFSKRIEVEKIAHTNKIGLEEAGRQVRYAFFEEVLQNTGAQKIATAHNKNDRVETMLMNIIRGSGTSGLKAIQVKRENKYIRPLIEIERKEIEQYCQKEKLQPRIDQTNEDIQYTRNKIRKCLLPYLEEEFNPNIVETLNRLSVIAEEQEVLLEEQIKKAYEETKIEETIGKQIVLDLKRFNVLEELLKKRLILHVVKQLLGTSQGIEKVHIEDIILLCNRNIGNKFLIPNKKVKILVKYKKIFFMVNTNLP